MASDRPALYVMRHGESLANVAGEIVSDPARGVPGFGLSPRGREQAQAAAEGPVRAAGVTVVRSSDFARARETAEVVHAHLGLAAALELDPDLRERSFGAFEGRQGAEWYPEVWRRDAARPDDPGDGIEPVAAVAARARRAAQRCREACGEGGVGLLVCHGDTAQILLAVSEGWDPARHRQVPHLETAGVRRLGPCA